MGINKATSLIWAERVVNYIRRCFEAFEAYIVAVVKENERTAAAGITNISRNITQASSPSLAGYILQSLSFLSDPLVIGGVLKIVYDVALYFNFKNIKPSDE